VQARKLHFGNDASRNAAFFVAFLPNFRVAPENIHHSRACMHNSGSWIITLVIKRQGKTDIFEADELNKSATRTCWNIRMSIQVKFTGGKFRTRCRNETGRGVEVDFSQIRTYGFLTHCDKIAAIYAFGFIP
jgi:hypothetical protein